MRRAAAVISALVLAVTLAGCGEYENTPERNLERGKQCFEAGGSWTWSDWSGYKCEFVQEGSDR